MTQKKKTAEKPVSTVQRIAHKVKKGMLDMLAPWRDAVSVGVQKVKTTFATGAGNAALTFTNEEGKDWSCLEDQLFGLHFSAPDRGLLLREDGTPSQEHDENYGVNPEVPFGRNGRTRVLVFG